MNYINYCAEDFAADESFQDYHLLKKNIAKNFWEKWINTHPAKVSEIEKAKKLLDVLHIQVPEGEAKDAFSDLETKINQKKALTSQIRPRRHYLFQLVGVAAACLALILGAYHFLSPTPSAVWSLNKTAFGEMKELNLPDGSTVILNSNSTLKYDSNWLNTATREVWLEGEAFFEINKQPLKGAAQFIVHSNDTKVAVLGTVFNVYNRNENIAVVLESGKVEVEYQKGGTNHKQLMAPNDIFEINKDKQVRFQESINTQLYTAWKENKLVLDQTPLRKVVNILEENFGFEVEVSKQEILDRKLTATIPIIDIKILLDALREIYGLDIKKEDRKIWIG